MLNLLRDLPFADTLGPLLLASALWSAAHIFFIAPNVIAPRLSETIYQPQCEAGIKQAWHKAESAKQSRLKELHQRKRAELLHKQQMAERLIEQSFGPLGQRLKELGMFRALDALDMPLLPEPETNPSPSNAYLANTAREYCGCVIGNLLGKQIATGLYSASFRFWKPSNIQTLESLSFSPIQLPQCSAPAFLN